MGSITKTLVFVALLVGAGCFLGFVFQRIGENYGLLFSPSMSLLYLGLWFLGALVAVAVTGGLAAVLLRPFSILALAFALSAVGMFATWEFSAVSGILAAIYLAVGLLYSRGIRGELNNRIKFSVGHILRSQAILLVVLAGIACASFYFGYAAEIEREGFTVPPAAIDMIVEAMGDQIDAGMTPAEREAALAQFREDFEAQVESTLEPYESYIPMGLGAALFMPLTSVVLFLSWIPILILALLFLILTYLGVTHEVTETREVTRLSLE